MNLLYNQEVHHFDDLYPTTKGHESKNCAFGNEESSFVSEIERTFTFSYNVTKVLKFITN